MNEPQPSLQIMFLSLMSFYAFVSTRAAGLVLHDRPSERSLLQVLVRCRRLRITGDGTRWNASCSPMGTSEVLLANLSREVRVRLADMVPTSVLW